MSVFAADPTIGACVPSGDLVTRVSVVAGPELLPAAGHAAELLRQDGHEVTVAPFDDLAGLADADAVLVFGGLEHERAARAAAPAHAYVRTELLEGPASSWDALVVRAVRSAAIFAAPQHVGMCG